MFAVTILLSAFLLFEVQPMLAKYILPWFGGSAAVWSAALLFFQLVLLGGYLYAHCLVRYFRPKAQIAIHVALLAVSLATLPIVPSLRWRTIASGDPTLQILTLLAATVGLPYLLLSATSPLLQAWYLRTHQGSVPYRLFALSNLGSMLALLSYPFVIEPKFTLSVQARSWSIAFAAFAVLCALTGFKDRDATFVRSDENESDEAPPRPATILLWIGLAACASTLLLAVTSHLTQNVAPIPMLWIAPLSLYLLSFILCFENQRLYNRYLFLPLLAIALGFLVYGDYLYENNAELPRLIPGLCAALFVCCMVCHGELARSKPHPRHLTLFYLMVATGGAIGGLFVALLAPRIFTDYFELPIAMAAIVALLTCVFWNAPRGRGPIRVAMTLATLGFAIYLGRAEIVKQREYLLSVRNFYGVLRVRDDPERPDHPARRILIHGTISHGTQLARPGGDRIATSYFGTGSGVSRAIVAKGQQGPLRIGVIGLGAGVTATLARSGDVLHYYEINPLVLDIARRDFGFLRACPAHPTVALGDARLVLESLPPESLDVLVLDAFSSDAIPVHLLTREAFQIYLRHVKPDAVMALHITNRFLDLEPVVTEAAKEIGWTGMTVTDDGNDENFYSPSSWVVLSRSATIFKHAIFQDGFVDTMRSRTSFRPWTDDYSNLVQILK